ncbi:MAG: heavy metal translocating P-type ATPase, partial [Oscillospiraceae bacterium]
MQQKFNISGMTCAACSARVEKVTRALPGVDKADVNLLGGTMTAKFDESVTKPEDIIAAVTTSGYGASLPNVQKREEQKRPDNSEELRHMKTRFFASLGFLIPLMYLTMGGMAGLPVPAVFSGMENALVFAFAQLLLTLPVMIINRSYYEKGFKTLIHGGPNMDSLIAVGSGAAAVYGVFAIFRMSYGLGHGDMALVHTYAHELYFDSAAMILTLITLGKYLETRSKGRTGDAIARLLELSPETAVVERGDAEVTIPAGDVQLGDVVLLRPGSRVPVDGVIIEGSSAIDQSALTGESIPVGKTVGDRVAAATINKTGFIKFRADRIGEDTTLSKIIKLVEEAGASKAPIARLADKVAGIFVPVVMVIAAVTFGVWLALGYGFEFALTSGIAVLVISCPCALGLATPVAIMVGTGRGAEEGILIKSAEALETLHKVGAVVLDKTGTLTEGKPTVTDIVTGELGEGELVQIAVSLEKPSEHPLAEAILAYAEQRHINPEEISDFEVVSGRGISAVVRGARCLGGNAAFMAENGVQVPADRGESFAEAGKTPLYFARDGRFAGIIAVADTIKSTSAEAIRRFRQMGIETHMLTGDNAVTAQAIAKSLGLDGMVSDVLPEDKEAKIRELQSTGKVVAMIGDGINDAPALARADVGVAIGAGTDVAIESADIVLMKSDLLDAVAAVELSRAVIRNIRMNLFWAFFYNILGIPIAAGVLFIPFAIKLSPMLGAAAMSFSSVFVVTNALRLRFFKPSYQKNTNDDNNNDVSKGEKKMATVLKVEG